MSSCRRICTLVVLVCVFFLSPASTSATIDDDKVNLSLYYESLCPFCANFIVNQLRKVFTTDLVSIVNLRLVPWGNTQVGSDKSWICQHGPDECLLDKVEACAINVWPNKDTHFRLIFCIERLQLQNRHSDWQACFRATGLSPDPVMKCYRGDLGVQLEQRYSDETARLNPPHRFVPWVLVNDLPLQEDYQNFVAYICKAYKGRRMPRACISNALDTNSTVMTTSTNQVCSTEDKDLLQK